MILVIVAKKWKEVMIMGGVQISAVGFDVI